MFPERKKTDKELSDFMMRVNCTREYAETIPLKSLLNIIAILPEKPIPLTETEIEFCKELAKKIANGYRRPIKIIERVAIPRLKLSN